MELLHHLSLLVAVATFLLMGASALILAFWETASDMSLSEIAKKPEKVAQHMGSLKLHHPF